MTASVLEFSARNACSAKRSTSESSAVRRLEARSRRMAEQRARGVREALDESEPEVLDVGEAEDGRRVEIEPALEEDGGQALREGHGEQAVSRAGAEGTLHGGRFRRGQTRAQGIAFGRP